MVTSWDCIPNSNRDSINCKIQFDLRNVRMWKKCILESTNTFIFHHWDGKKGILKGGWSTSQWCSHGERKGSNILKLVLPLRRINQADKKQGNIELKEWIRDHSLGNLFKFQLIQAPLDRCFCTLEGSDTQHVKKKILIAHFVCF